MGIEFKDNELIIGGTEWTYVPFRFSKILKIGSGVTPTWQDVILSGNGSLTLPNAKQNGLNYVKLYGASEKDTTPTSMDYNTAYNMQHSTFDGSKVTVTGTPTITSDGIASDFTGSNRITTTIDYSGSSLEITCGYYWETDSDGANIFWLSRNNNLTSIFRFYQSNNNNCVLFAARDENLNFLATEYSPNTNDFIIIKAKLNSDNTVTGTVINVTQNVTVTKTTTGTISNVPSATGNILYVGNANGNERYIGKIDLKQLSIKLDGIPVFSGNQTGIDTVKPNNYTVVGSPTISDDGIASGFSTSNYLRGYVFSPESSAWKIKFTFMTASTVSAGHLYTSTNSVNGVNIIINNGNKLGLHLSNNGTSYNICDISTDDVLQANTRYYAIAEFDGNSTYKLSCSTDGINFITKSVTSSQALPSNTSTMGIIGCSTYFGSAFGGSIDLNSFEIYVNDELVYQPCLKIPYTESARNKIVDSYYLTRVQSASENLQITPYIVINNSNNTATDYRAKIICNNGILKVNAQGQVYADGTTETVKDSKNNTATATMLLSVGDYTDVQEVLTGAVTRNCEAICYNGTQTINTPYISNTGGLDAGAIIVHPKSTAATESVTAQTLTTQSGTNTIEITQGSINNLPLEVSYKAGVTVTIEQIENAQLDENVEVTING